MIILSIIAILIFIIFGLDLLCIFAEILGGTKFRGQCIEYVEMIEEDGTINENYGCVFKYNDNGEDRIAYTHCPGWCYADKTYKIIVSDKDPVHCSKVKDINKSYLFDLLMVTVSAIIIFI